MREEFRLLKAQGDKRYKYLDDDYGEDKNWEEERTRRLLLNMGMSNDFEAALKSLICTDI